MLVEAAQLFPYPFPAEKIAGRKTSVRLLIAARAAAWIAVGGMWFAPHAIGAVAGFWFVEHVAAFWA